MRKKKRPTISVDDLSINKDTDAKKPKKKRKNYYFDMNVQNKIVEYQNSNSQSEKSVLYENHIYPAFRDLVQSLVSVYGFKSSNAI